MEGLSLLPELCLNLCIWVWLSLGFRVCLPLLKELPEGVTQVLKAWLQGKQLLMSDACINAQLLKVSHSSIMLPGQISSCTSVLLPQVIDVEAWSRLCALRFCAVLPRCCAVLTQALSQVVLVVIMGPTGALLLLAVWTSLDCCQG